LSFRAIRDGRFADPILKDSQGFPSGSHGRGHNKFDIRNDHGPGKACLRAVRSRKSETEINIAGPCLPRVMIGMTRSFDEATVRRLRNKTLNAARTANIKLNTSQPCNTLQSSKLNICSVSQTIDIETLNPLTTHRHFSLNAGTRKWFGRE
jgi:hypothetical protein